MIYILIVLAVLVGFILGVGVTRFLSSRSTAHGSIDFVDIGEPNVLYISSEESKKLSSSRYLKLLINHVDGSQN